MAPATLLLDALFFALSGSLYAYVGLLTIRRRIGGEGQLASTLFGVWWFLLASLQGVTGILRALAWAEVLTLELYTAVVYLSMGILSAALWALVYYLFYLLSGSRRVLVPITAFYSLYYAALLYVVAYQTPASLQVDAWSIRLEYERTIAGIPLALTMLALLLPPVVGALGYARLFFHAEDPTQRYRIGLVSATIAVWFGIAILAWVVEASTLPWWRVVERLIGLGAALVIYLAYRPPPWIRRQYGVRPIDEPAPT